MACSFWESSHCKRWLFTAEELEEHRAKCKPFLNEEQVQIMNDEMMRLMNLVGESLKWRQTVIASSKLLYKRFFIKERMNILYDPRLIAITCLYLAAKIEELGQYSVKTILSKVHEIQEARKYEFPHFGQQHVHDFEFHILGALSFDLVVFHPYQELTKYIKDAQIENKACIDAAWTILNDSYLSDVILMYPPYLIAMAALYMACVHSGTDSKAWFSRLNVRLEAIRDIVNLIMDMYQSRAKAALSTTQNIPKVMKLVRDRFAENFKKQKAEHEKRAKEQQKSSKRKKMPDKNASNYQAKRPRQ
mmetsp:Transcript_486/g.1188  ORF Transcript_486/g.1188 Transcript_486/m.1188 type:complete len:304 (-) Transcript_486:302-1213(-)